jgi:hypothetical protein
MKPMVATDDLVFKTQGDTEVLRFEDSGDVDIAGGYGDSGVTISAIAGAISADGRIITDDATNATSISDGSIQTDGGLSVTLDAVFGDNVKLLSDSAVLNFGADNDVTLTHVADTGLTLNGSRKLMFTDSNAFVHHDGTGLLIQDDMIVQLAGNYIQLGYSTSQVTNITGPATSSVGISIEPATRFNNTRLEPAFKISGSMLLADGGDPISIGASAASASLDAIPYMQIMGVDAGGLLQEYKIQVSGGMLQLNQL